ncbi:MAG TPA: FKBP-type peptidyl-prolyl cis-trans isomerase [Paludibacteraceae bacterium]|jgi:FKBP-type peptidyl-prolyl cis-trans isomerase FklB|nr:FKBP-type peptidyl-prolyl cis-trans isomerase [Paludibacteraceae bacterium]HOU67320.1 FKBP-type peptidyl-prolyl cis-trans isomerase [Paludibacteraceae bacterium]HPH63742.1 FKBP-type peptidyl-prolyl cis-trans isomerase [Paludibacteraceae bacterium]HQF49416.1 FKBP-type peptidyl-prolyl cis-trans isomerase [Paludibacteraceae bacterium]HQJ90545.1 FKBP-type peptidyl-prolyl cis-trans isomerase [Paludibacteraceae bacterium]
MKDISYALGLSMAQNFLNSGIDNLDIESFKNGVSDIFGKKQPSMSLDNARDLINSYFAKIQQEAGEKDKKAGAEFLKANKEKKGVIETESGLQYEIITAGTGAKPKATNTVRCHYEGTLINGTVFDSSYRRNQPADFPVNQVIPGWVEALQLMPVGSKWRLYVPSNLAYGEYGAGDQIGPNATLIFDVELLKIL